MPIDIGERRRNSPTSAGTRLGIQDRPLASKRVRPAGRTKKKKPGKSGSFAIRIGKLAAVFARAFSWVDFVTLLFLLICGDRGAWWEAWPAVRRSVRRTRWM